jgi:UDP-N-acetylmuramate dehydrogenase
MNAGAYGHEVKDSLIWIECITPKGQYIRLAKDELSMRYRNGNIPAGWIVTKAAFKLEKAPQEHIKAKIDEYLFLRESSQPIRGRTGGSTFKNPFPMKAWELIDKAGCRGLTQGDAQISEKHCNFMLNLGNARALDLEQLGESVRERVFDRTNVLLEWEIIRWGEY